MAGANGVEGAGAGVGPLAGANDQETIDQIDAAAHAGDIDAMIEQQKAFQTEMMANMMKSNVSKALTDCQKDIARNMK